MRTCGLAWAAVALLAVGGCSKGPDEATGRAGPEIGATPQADTAYAYTYSFRAPAARIAALQERHARGCEALGPARCRITGMTYDVHGDGDASGRLEMELAPPIARRFGASGVAAVVADGGMLDGASLTSEKAAAVAAAARDQARVAQTEQAQATDEMNAGRSTARERADLRERRATAAETATVARAVAADAQARLAATPMTFAYVSGMPSAGFGDGPVTAAIKQGWVGAVRILAAILGILIALLPCAALAMAAFWLWRRFAGRVRNWGRRGAATAGGGGSAER